MKLSKEALAVLRKLAPQPVEPGDLPMARALEASGYLRPVKGTRATYVLTKKGSARLLEGE